MAKMAIKIDGILNAKSLIPNKYMLIALDQNNMGGLSK
jgi:hypothetical protein